MRTEASAPVQSLQLAALIHTEGIGAVAAIEAHDLLGLCAA